MADREDQVRTNQQQQQRSFAVFRVNNATTIGGAHEDFDLTAFEQPPFQGNNLDGRNGHGINSVRNHLFHVMLVKLALGYAQHTTPRIRRFIEFIVLSFALLCLFMLIYIHLLVPAVPSNCLDHIKETWPKRGIIRIEVVKNWNEYNSYLAALHKKRQHQTHFSIKDVFIFGPKALPEELKKVSRIYEAFKFDSNPPTPSDVEATFFETWLTKAGEILLDVFSDSPPQTGQFIPDRSVVDFIYDIEKEKESNEIVDDITSANGPFLYVVEYSIHHGLLRLPVDLRTYYNVPVMLVQLSADDDTQCLAPYRKQGIARFFMGYDDILMNSVKSLAENLTEKGYLYDLIKNEHYHFVSYAPNRFVYLTALLVMLIFTFAISMLLRFSHHQIFLFIVDLLHMFELNQPLVFPIAPLLTVLLALVGMEAIMSEVFIDTTTAFYVILLVWIVDQYDAICCHSNVGKKFFLRFFYLYHFSFYAYHYRYSGQYTGSALITSATFVIHSMIFFFHHYELPIILYNDELQRLIRRLQQQGNELQQLGRNEPTPSDADSSLPIAEVYRGLSVSRNLPEPLRTDILREAQRMHVRILGEEPTLFEASTTTSETSSPSTSASSSDSDESSTSSTESQPPPVIIPPSVLEGAEITANNLVQQTMHELFDSNIDDASGN